MDAITIELKIIFSL